LTHNAIDGGSIKFCNPPQFKLIRYQYGIVVSMARAGRLPRHDEWTRPPTEEAMDPEIHQSLKQSAIIIGSVFAGLVILWILVAGLGLGL
jgi:hypothetical protein